MKSACHKRRLDGYGNLAKIQIAEISSKEMVMKNFNLALCFIALAFGSLNAHPLIPEADRSVQVYKRDALVPWNRENAGGGVGPLLGDFAYNRHQTNSKDAFREIGWLTLPKGASIGLHKHTDNEDVYIIISGKGVFTDSNGKQTEVSTGDVTIARPGQSHALANIGEEPLVFLNLIAKTESELKK